MTNLNATRKFEAKGHDPADPNVWTPIGTVPQFNTFSGLCFAMGAICVPRRSDYWRHNYWTLDILSFSDIMPRNRFSYILQCLHVCDEVDAPAPDVPHTDKINKIRPFINTLVPHLARCASQPESSVLKDWTLPIHSISADTLWDQDWVPTDLESKSGYVVEFSLYHGKEEVHHIGLASDVANKLIKAHEGKGHHLYVDNFHISIPLFKVLFETKVYACGTCRRMSSWRMR